MIKESSLFACDGSYCRGSPCCCAINVDVIVTSTPIKADERRALTGELKRMAPEATVVLIAESDEESAEARQRYYAGLGAVLSRQTMADSLRRVVQFGLDGFGMQPQGIPRSVERRYA